MREHTYDDVVRLKDHYIALGDYSVYIFSADATYKTMPWDKVIAVKSGGMHRLSIPVGLEFTASVDDSPLTVRWTIDLEYRDSNGTGTYKFNTEKLTWIFNRLPDDVKRQLKGYFQREVLPAVRKLTDEIYDSYVKNKTSQNVIETFVNELEIKRD